MSETNVQMIFPRPPAHHRQPWTNEVVKRKILDHLRERNAVVPVAEVAASIPCPVIEAKPFLDELERDGLIAVRMRPGEDWRTGVCFITGVGIEGLEAK